MKIIAGLYRHQSLKTPQGVQTRPTASRLRESLFNICQGYIEGVRFLDLFAGSGAMGLEALSRGAQSATFVDSSREAIQCIKHNAASLRVEKQCQIFQGQVFPLLGKLQQQELQFDIIFADPPYQMSGEFEGTVQIFYSQKIIQWIDENSLLASKGILFVEEDSRTFLELENLKTLQFKKSRRMGGTILLQYERL